jgi:hypothetical protein
MMGELFELALNVTNKAMWKNKFKVWNFKFEIIKLYVEFCFKKILTWTRVNEKKVSSYYKHGKGVEFH